MIVDSKQSVSFWLWDNDALKRKPAMKLGWDALNARLVNIDDDKSNVFSNIVDKENQQQNQWKKSP